MSDVILDLFEYSSDATAQSTYVSNGILGTWVVAADSGEIVAADAYTKLSIHGDSISDVTGKTVTNNGAVVSTAQYKFGELGRSIFFDGTDDYLSLADSADWYFAAGDFTIEAWVFCPSFSGAGLGFYIATQSDSAVPSMSWRFFMDDDGDGISHVHFSYFTDPSQTFYTVAGSGVMSANTWYHLAFVRYGNTGTLYQDGAIVGTIDMTGHTLYDSSAACCIGCYLGAGSTPGAPGGFFSGYINSLRVSKGTARYTTTFVPPTAPFAGARTYYVFSGLDGDTDQEYRLIVRQVAGADSSFLYARFNGDTAANYGRQQLTGTNTTVDAYRTTTATSMYFNYSGQSTGGITFVDALIYAKSGYVRTVVAKLAMGIATTTVTDVQEIGHVWNNTADNLISITVFDGATNGLGVGSRFILLKRTSVPTTKSWELIGRHEVTGSAETSYTFSGLNGDADILYNLVVRHLGANDNYARLRFNNDSGSNYGQQSLQGVNTTPSANQWEDDNIILNSAGSAAEVVGFSETLIYAKSGYIRTLINQRVDSVNGTTIYGIGLDGGSWNNTIDNVTSLVIYHSSVGLDIGTVLELYRLNL